METISLCLFNCKKKQWRVQDFPWDIGPLGTLTFYYRLQTKLREGNVFIPVCDSVHRGVCIPACNGRGCLPLGPWVCTCPWADIPLSRHPPGQSPLGHTLPQTATEAGGTHPTGMYSCFVNFSENLFET